MTLSVVMPVRNGGALLKDAMKSILCQTLRDFEFIIINDGSDDDTEEQIKSFDDCRIKYVCNRTSAGISACLNWGMELAKGEYIARMDADDVSLPNRLEKQVQFLDRNRDVVVCGTSAMLFNDSGFRRIARMPTADGGIRCHFVFNCALIHPSVVMRAKVLKDNAITYNSDYDGAEDYELWNRVAAYGKFANLSDVLLRYRVPDGMQYGNKYKDKLYLANGVRRAFLRLLQIDPTDAELSVHNVLAQAAPCDGCWDIMNKARLWLNKLKTCNEKLGSLPKTCFSKTITKRWIRLCLQRRRLLCLIGRSRRPSVSCTTYYACFGEAVRERISDAATALVTEASLHAHGG